MKFPIDHVAKGISATIKIIGHNLGLDPKFVTSAGTLGSAVYVYNRHELGLRHEHLSLKMTDTTIVINKALEVRGGYPEGVSCFLSYLRILSILLYYIY